MIVKIMGIVAAAFCGISLIVPWAGFGPLSVYPWGGTSITATGQSQLDFFFIQSMTSGAGQMIAYAICMIIAFILVIIALIIGILGAKNLAIKMSNSFLIAGILSIVAIVLCVVSVSQVNAMIGQFTGGFITIAIGYSWGFFLMIFAVVMFFVAFGLQKVFVSAPAPAVTQPMYQQPMQTQAPAQYYAQQPQTPPPPAQTTPPPPPQPQAPPSPVQPTTSKAQTGAKFCPACGAKLEGKPKFCDKCGKKLVGVI